MQILKQAGVALMLGVIIAACGGKAPTQAPDGNGGNGGGATEQPAATEDNGGNGGGTIGSQYGKVTYTVDGPVKASGELGFIPQASSFGGDQGSALNFGNSDSGGAEAKLLSIVVGADGSVLVSFAGPEGQVPGATCTTSNWNMGAGNASGKFDCTASMSLTPSGATVAGGTIKGEFTAHT